MLKHVWQQKHIWKDAYHCEVLQKCKINRKHLNCPTSSFNRLIISSIGKIVEIVRHACLHIHEFNYIWKLLIDPEYKLYNFPQNTIEISLDSNSVLEKKICSFVWKNMKISKQISPSNCAKKYLILLILNPSSSPCPTPCSLFLRWSIWKPVCGFNVLKVHRVHKREILHMCVSCVWNETGNGNMCVTTCSTQAQWLLPLH